MASLFQCVFPCHRLHRPVSASRSCAVVAEVFFTALLSKWIASPFFQNKNHTWPSQRFCGRPLSPPFRRVLVKLPPRCLIPLGLAVGIVRTFSYCQPFCNPHWPVLPFRAPPSSDVECAPHDPILSLFNSPFLFVCAVPPSFDPGVFWATDPSGNAFVSIISLPMEASPS